MNAIDAVVFAFLALAGLALIFHLRRAQLQRVQVGRMKRGLKLVLQREALAPAAVPHKRHLLRAE
jgi:hypothetical protein